MKIEMNEMVLIVLVVVTGICIITKQITSLIKTLKKGKEQWQ